MPANYLPFSSLIFYIFYRRTIFLIALFCFPFLSFPQAIELEPITVKKGPKDDSLQSLEFISSSNTFAYSIEEMVDYSSSLDLKKRSPFGIQQDVSLRGSIFEDANINLEGIKINDPQTGHFSLEIPLTSADIEGVEIYKNSQAINFSLKKPKKEGFLVKTSFGQHALWEELIALNFPLMKDINNRISIEHKSSSGGRPDTDFEIYNFSFHSLWDKEDKDLEFLFGSTQRDFGADSFYAASYPHEEEQISQHFFSLRGGLDKEDFDWDNTIYFRRHTDKYILNRHNPSFYTNYHTTYVYGLKSEFNFPNDLFFSLEAEREKVTSTNLNKHRRLKKGFSLGIKEKKVGDFAFDFKSGLDYYENWEYLENIHLGLGYFLRDNLSFRFSFDRLWRAPSFTELYYSSPSNVGNRDLGIQKSNNFELGLDYLPWPSFKASLDTFLRDQGETIDWVKNKSSDAWQADNVGSLKAYGFDFSLEAKFKDFLLERIGLGYTYLALDRENPYAFSKYVFDYNRHKLVGDLGFNIKGFSLDTIVNFSNPVGREEYATVDFKIEKKIADFILSLEGTNIFNKDYQEMTDIEGQGRWCKISLAYSF